MLYAFGAAIGLAGGEPGRVSTWLALYTLVVPILALFVGGFVAGRGDRVKNRFDAAMYGLVVWGFCALLGSVSVGAVAGMMANAANVPAGYAWAVFGSLLLSLIGAVLGALLGQSTRCVEEEAPRERKAEVPAPRSGEVYP